MAEQLDKTGIRRSMVESLKGLITLSEEIYGERETVH